MLKTIAWIIVVLVVVELGLEFRAHQRGYGTLLFGSPPPAGVVEGGPVDTTFGPTDAFPFRSRIVPAARTAGVPRLWLASASYGEDIYTAPPLIFANLVADRLQVEMLNASRAGHTIAGNTRFLAEEGATWRPDVVILYQLSLDIDRIARSLRGGAHENVPGVAESDDAETPAARRQPNILVRTYESTTMFQTLKEAIGGRLNQQRILLDDLGPEPPLVIRGVLADFVVVCRELGAEPVLCTFAASNDTGNYAETSARARTSLFNGDATLSLYGWTRTIDELNDVIREVAAAENLRLIDVAAVLDGQSRYYRDFIHFNRRGHEAMAQILVEGLSPVIGAAAVAGEGEGDEF